MLFLCKVHYALLEFISAVECWNGTPMVRDSRFPPRLEFQNIALSLFFVFFLQFLADKEASSGEPMVVGPLLYNLS